MSDESKLETSLPASGDAETAELRAVVVAADDDKAAKIAEAKARVASAKEAGEQTPGAPKPPVKKKDEGPKPVDASSHRLAVALSKKFDGAFVDASEFLGQLSVRVERTRITEVCQYLKSDQSFLFNYLSDLTCVHIPERADVPFDVIYNLYSIPLNHRVRLKVATSESEGVETVSGVWPTANWLEREVFDLFGVPFSKHPDLRRILLPPDWEGHPLRKDYPLEFVENDWTRKHLPEMTDVQREQLEQRRNYGLDILSVPEERQMRDIFRGSKDVMTKDR